MPMVLVVIAPPTSHCGWHQVCAQQTFIEVLCSARSGQRPALQSQVAPLCLAGHIANAVTKATPITQRVPAPPSEKYIPQSTHPVGPRVTSYTTCPCSVSRPGKCHIMSTVSSAISPLRFRMRITETVGKTSKLHFEKEAVRNITQITLSKTIWGQVLDPEFKAAMGNQRVTQRVTLKLFRLQLERCYFSLVFLPLERREFQSFILAATSASWGPTKKYFPAQQGKTSYFLMSFSHLLAPH